jgi:hypothetical protein
MNLRAQLLADTTRTPYLLAMGCEYVDMVKRCNRNANALKAIQLKLSIYFINIGNLI